MSKRMDLRSRIDECVRYIQSRSSLQPTCGIILGTGLGAFSQSITNEVRIPYADLPHFEESTVDFHVGEFIIGMINKVPIIAMEGRFHFYEGYTLEQITFPVRVIKAMGAHSLIVSNACGGLNPDFSLGDIMLIDDHINLMGVNPLIGANEPELGPRFPDMCYPYDQAFITSAESVAAQKEIPIQKGVFAAMTGPCLETRAEYRYLQRIGADAIGMSTVPEVIVAVHAGLRVLGISVITDMCLPDKLKPVNIEEIIATANKAEPNLTAIVQGVIEKLSSSP